VFFEAAINSSVAGTEGAVDEDEVEGPASALVAGSGMARLVVGMVAVTIELEEGFRLARAVWVVFEVETLDGLLEGGPGKFIEETASGKIELNELLSRDSSDIVIEVYAGLE